MALPARKLLLAGVGTAMAAVLGMPAIASAADAAVPSSLLELRVTG
ncbi:hypothetical protein [Streptomyces sp. NPDC056670]